LQRAAGIPQSDPVTSLELDRRITQGWLASATEVVVSHPRMRKEILAYVDGGARGNPGPAGFGVRIETPDGTLIEEFSESIGVATNNVAEYRGLLAALEWARDSSRTRPRARFARSHGVASRPSCLRRRGGIAGARSRNAVHQMMAAVWSELRTHDRLREIGADDLAVIPPGLGRCRARAHAPRAGPMRCTRLPCRAGARSAGAALRGSGSTSTSTASPSR
jgi:probable phosphoglycerate mutase